MFVRVLGPVGAGPDEGAVTAAPGRVAAGVLAHLVLARGRLVTGDSLALAVWDEPPEAARNAIQVAVSKLRKLFGAELVLSDRAGYRASTAFARVDLTEAEQLVAQARAAAQGHRPAEAQRLAELATTLFVGQPLAGLDTASAIAARERAEELRTEADLVRGQALTTLGRPEEAVALMRRVVARDPLQEPPHALLMTALAEAGRPAEALRVYEQLRVQLSEELGVDPSPQVAQIFTRLLDPPAAAPALPEPISGEPLLRLPPEGASIVGRDQELRLITELYAAGHRLVTLLGAGGVGKTRLAVAAAPALTAGRRPAFFVDLTLAAGAADVADTVASALEADGGDVATTLRGTNALVILDNAEHVLAATVDAAQELLGVPGTDVLVTSRSPLNLREERTLWLDVLPAEAPNNPAVRLLIERAGLSTVELATQGEALQDLARRADGVPLVLELLASALRWETAAQLLSHLDETLLELDDGARDRPRRHLNARSAVEWSVAQASSAARTGLGALSLLRGSFGLSTAVEILAAVVTPDSTRSVLAELVDLSLVQRVPAPGEVSFRLLELIRLSAGRSPLVPPPSFAAHQAHARHYLRRLQPAKLGRGTPDPAPQPLRRDESNLKVALEWSWEHDPDLALSAVAPLMGSFSPAAEKSARPESSA